MPTLPTWRGPSLAAFVAALLCTAPASASPFEDTTLGGAVFTGPTHANAAAMYINPAALGLDSQGTYAYLDVSGRLDQLSVDRSSRGVNGALTPGPPPVDAIVLAPGGMLAIYTVGGNVSAGAAFGIPMTEKFITEHDELGYHVLGGGHRRYALALAVSFRLSRRILVGTGLSLSKTTLDFSFLRDTALEGGRDAVDGIDSDCNDSPCGIENPDAAERYDIAVATSSFFATQNLALSVGVVYQVAQDWWLGIGVQSPAGFRSALSLQGQVTMNPSPRDPRTPFTGKAEVTYKLPETVAVAVRGPMPILPSYELVLGLRWQGYSRHDVLDLRIYGLGADERAPEWYPRYRGMRDVVAVEAGLEGVPGQRLRLGGRLRLESGAVAADALSPLQIAGPNLTLVGGGELRLSNSIALSASYGVTWFPTTRVDDSRFEPGPYLDCIDSAFDIAACTAVAEGRAVPSAAGSYGRISHAARLSLKFDLDW